MENAVIYARYSSHNQREESIEGQVRRCRAFAEQNNFVIVGEYIDRAISGRTDNRAGFQRMIEDSGKHQFTAVIMYTLDRFARDRYDAAMYKHILRNNGVRLYYTEQAITQDPEGVIFEALLEGMAEYYSANLARGVKRGLHENALKCMVTGGYMILGYRKSVDNKYEIDPKTAPIVREIFDLYTNGKSQRQIVDALNDKGYRTKRNKPFSLSIINKILCNKRYTGVYAYGGVEVAGGIPAIVEVEQYERAQELMTKNKRKTGRMTSPAAYLLTGKLFCGMCGSPMLGESGTSKTGAIYNYYKCFERKKNKTCEKSNERKEWLERLVVQETINTVLQPDAIDYISSKIAEIAERENNDTSRLVELQNDLNDTQKAIRNILRLVEQGVDTDDVSDRLLDLNAQKKDLQKQIAREETKKPKITKKKVECWLYGFLRGDPKDVQYQARIIDTLVNRVFVFDGDDGGKKIVITYNISDGRQSTINISDAREVVESSENDCLTPPERTIPNLFFLKSTFGIIVKIPGKG